MKVQTFLAIGGPLAGNYVTEQYAGDEYLRFNNSWKRPKCWACNKHVPRIMHDGIWRHSFQGSKGKALTKCNIQDINEPGCVLIHRSVWGV